MFPIYCINCFFFFVVIRQVTWKYKLKLKYGGFFRLARNSCRQVYCFGFRKTLYIDIFSYNLNQLVEEVKKHYPSKNDIVLLIVFIDKHAREQCFIKLDSDEHFMVMLNMYEEEKEVTNYAMNEKITQQRDKPSSVEDQFIEESDDEKLFC